MGFSNEKCVIIIMKNGKSQIAEGIDLPNQERIRTLEEKENCKHSEILEAENTNKMGMKLFKKLKRVL